MGFTDFITETGLTLLDSWLKTRSYIFGYGASQADVKVFEQLKGEPEIAKYPYAFRWYKHIASFKSEFSALPGDPSKAATAYGPETSEVTVNPATAPEKEEAADDDDIDLFGEESEEDEEKKAETERRLAEYKKKKEGKVKPAAKTSVTLDVKPWDDETDMKALEESVVGIEMPGLTWGKSQLVPIGYGIKKLQINLVVEDDKVSLDELEERIQEFTDYVQSTDVAAMQKI